MENLDRLRTVRIGGFAKEDVLNYIDEMVRENESNHKRMLEQIKDSSVKLQEKENQLQDLQGKLRQCVIQFQKAKNSIKLMEDNHQAIIDEKNNRLEEVEMANRQLSYKVKVLEEKLGSYNSLDQEQQELISKAEKISRDKTNQMIHEAKKLVENEYHKRLNQAKSDATSIIQDAEQRARQILIKSKMELKQYAEHSEQKSQEIIQKAKATAQKIISDAAQEKLDVVDDGNIIEHKDDIVHKFEQNMDSLRENIYQDVKEVIQHLDSASASVETAKIKAEKIPNIDSNSVKSNEHEQEKEKEKNKVEEKDKENDVESSITVTFDKKPEVENKKLIIPSADESETTISEKSESNKDNDLKDKYQVSKNSDSSLKKDIPKASSAANDKEKRVPKSSVSVSKNEATTTRDVKNPVVRNSKTPMIRDLKDSWKYKKAIKKFLK